MHKINRLILILTIFCVLLMSSLSLAACATSNQQNYNTKTTRIKIFTSFDTTVEDGVNNWIEENCDDIVIVDIQYKCALTGTNYSTSARYTVCVVYYLR